jgi:hypothetical protein
MPNTSQQNQPFNAKDRIRPGDVMIDATPERFEWATYVLRYSRTPGFLSIDTIVTARIGLEAEAAA